LRRADLPDIEGQNSLFARSRRWPASFQVAAKIAAGFVEELDRMADTLFALLLPGERFWLQRLA